MDIYDRIEAGEFENKVRYPSKPHKPRLSVDHSVAEVKQYVESLEIYEVELERWQDDMKVYRDAERSAKQHFKESLLAYLDIADHPLAEKLYSMAWDRGHSEGLYRIAEEADELSELLK